MCTIEENGRYGLVGGSRGHQAVQPLLLRIEGNTDVGVGAGDGGIVLGGVLVVKLLKGRRRKPRHALSSSLDDWSKRKRFYKAHYGIPWSSRLVA